MSTISVNLRDFGARTSRRLRRNPIFPWNHLLLGVIIAAVGISVLPPGEHWVQEVRKAVGGSLLAIGLVGLLYDHLFVRRVIGSYFDLLKIAANLEIERLYADRAEALEDIAQELAEASGAVKICCISGSDFLGVGRVAGAISNLIENRQNVHLRFLLQDIRSRYALLRAWIEEKYETICESQEGLDDGELEPDYTLDDFRQSTMKARISAAQASLHAMSRRLRLPTRLSVRYYRYLPSLFLVIVNRSVFVEIYHWGVDPEYVPMPVMPCIAKRTFVVRFRRHSLNGASFENHFDRIWRCSQTKRVLPGTMGPDEEAQREFVFS
ncbi:MAG TPA: hypothetical protein VMI94_29065 [Bryobacteraceae bacterium]|nr:hypothetical protein [Bryobacteraceae bacterium]